MAEYQKKLESAADALARKQLGIEPKKDGVEEQERLPEIYEKFKKEYLSVLEDSFTEVCAQMKMQLGVRHLSDDTLLIIANKINDKAISGDLKFVSDLSQDKEIVAAVEDASRVQKEQTEATNAIEGEVEGKDNTSNQVVEGTMAVAMTMGFAQEMKNLNDMFDNWRDNDMSSMRGKAKEYLESEERKNRNKDIEIATLKKYRDASTSEEKIKYATIIHARDGMARSLQAQLQSIENGNDKAYAGSIFSVARMIAVDEDRSVDEILNEFRTMSIQWLGDERAKKMLEEFEGVQGIQDRKQAVDILLDKFEEMVIEEGGQPRKREDLERIIYRKSKIVEKDPALRGVNQMSDIEIEENAEQNIATRESVGLMMRNRIRLAKKQVNYSEIQAVLDSKELLSEHDFELFVKTLGMTAVEMGDMRLIGMHQEYAEKDKLECEAKVVEAEEVAVEEPTVAEPTAPKVDFDEGPDR